MQMHKKQTRNLPQYRQLVVKSIIVSIILLILICVKQYIIQVQIFQEENIANMINIAGRQRMLSQKITKDVLLIRLKAENSDLSYIINDLEEMLDVWVEKEELLFLRTSENKMIKKNSSIWQLFEDSKPCMEEVIRASNEVIAAVKDNRYSQKVTDEKLDIRTL